jgi:DNA invertase Pin-like site-specific DNA recombinase
MSRPEAVPAVRAAIYCRISLAKHGDTIKVDDQEKLCRQVAAQRGWRVYDSHVFKDPNRSAWQRNRRRPAWNAMLDAVNDGEVDAIIVYHGDRLIRQPWDLELLLRLADDKGIRLASPTGERNLDNADDRFILRIEAAQACRESDNTSRRTRRHYQRQAEQGLVRLGGRGGRAFGFEPDGLTIRRADAEAVRWAAERVLDGDPIGVICRALNARGVRTTAGNEWGHGALKKLLLRPRLAGLLPERHGLAPAAWPAILDRGTWESVRAVLQGKAGAFGYASNARRYLLTGLAACGSCDRPLAIRHSTRSESLRGYGCINPACPRKVHRNVRHLDGYVSGLVVGLLNDAEVRASMAVESAPDLAGKLAALEDRRELLLAAFAEDDEAGPEVIRGTIGPLSRRIEALRAEVARSRASHALDDLWGIDRDGWYRLSAVAGGLAKQRAAVAGLVRVTVFPNVRRGPGFDPSTVRVELLG